MRLIGKKAVVKRSDFNSERQTDLVFSREGGHPAMAERMTGAIRKTVAAGFIATGVITALIATVTLVIGVALLMPQVVSAFRHYFGKSSLPGQR